MTNAMARLKAKIASMPSTQDTVQRCSGCGEPAVHFHDVRLTERVVRQFIKCDACGREVTVKLVQA